MGKIQDGLVVLGLEAPEFAYEKIPTNVAVAVKQDGLTYPIAIDGNLSTWTAYQNQYWPAEYLIDRNGNVRREHFGEGEYDQTEQAIRGLLAENSTTQLSPTLVAPSSVSVPITSSQTPETYLGTDRANAYTGSPGLGSQADQTYSFAPQINTSQWSLSGEWQVSGSAITTQKNAKIRISVAAKNVYIVGGAPTQSSVGVLLDGQPISKASAGADVTNATLAIQLSTLYRIASFKDFTTGTIELDVPNGVKLNTFTFGS